LRQADQQVQAALAALDQGDVAGARAAYATFEATWGQIEDGIRDADRGAYRAIEDAMLDVKLALKAEPVDAQAAGGALRTLHDTNARFISRQPTSAATTASTGAGAGDAERPHGLLVHIDTARAGIAHQDAAAALAALKGFQSDWPAIEGAVRTKSPAAYTATENDLAEAQALLSAQPPRLAETDALLARMHERLVPIVESGASYGVFDASIIMLREGLEALLVISALVAFLKKSGNEDKQRWIWAGAAMGAVLSVGLALALQQTFSRAGAALGSEIVEGITGLAAAGMLFYVSYWLHSKARLGAWQRYIREKSTAALARGSVLSLGLITLLAVFREGAETSLFYLGIAPSIALGDLALGIALGTLALIAAGFVILALGRRLPLRPFFLASSALIYYLGFKFVGTGLHALQVAGVLPATPAPMPSSDLLGVYPTWETMLPQVALLAIAAAIVWLSTRYQARQAPPTAA
jgi:high-affinity iron transporter